MSDVCRFGQDVYISTSISISTYPSVWLTNALLINSSYLMHYLKIPTRVVNTYIYIYIILYIYNTCQHLLRDSILRLQDGAT
jgi:hypothetical protein